MENNAMVRTPACVRLMCICLTHTCSNESGAILWPQTRFPNKRRMLSMASRVFHWNHTFIQPVSCPWVFLSAWTGEKREPSVSLSFSPLFLLCLPPPSPHAFSHPFHRFFSLLHHLGSVNVGYWSSLFFSLCWLSLVWFWSDTRTWLTQWVRPI